MLRLYSERYFVEVHELQTELGVYEAGGPLILEHSVVTVHNFKE